MDEESQSLGSNSKETGASEASNLSEVHNSLLAVQKQIDQYAQEIKRLDADRKAQSDEVRRVNELMNVVVIVLLVMVAGYVVDAITRNKTQVIYNVTLDQPSSK